MGNTNARNFQRGNRLSSIENIKQNPYEDSNYDRKKTLSLPSAAWKRLVESTKRRGNKGVKSQQAYETLQRVYDISTKPLTGLSNGVVDTKLVFQQPPSLTLRTQKEFEMDVPEHYMSSSLLLPRLFLDSDTKTAIISKSNHSNLLSNRKEFASLEHPQFINTKTSLSNKKILALDAKCSNTRVLRKVVIQASTSEMLRCLGQFVYSRCCCLSGLGPNDVIIWWREIDRSLRIQGWQDITFIMPSSVVFVYMLCREMIPANVGSVHEVKCIMFACLYMSYTYMGNEISYPLRPFLIECDRYMFWSRCCQIMNKLSGKMMFINQDTRYFAKVFCDLKTYNRG